MTELLSEDLLCRLIEEVRLDEQKEAVFCDLWGHFKNNHNSSNY